MSILTDLLLPSRLARKALTARQRALVYAVPAVLAGGLLVLFGIVLISAAGLTFSLPSFLAPALGVLIMLSFFGSIGTKGWAEVTVAVTDSPVDRSSRNRMILLSLMGISMPLAAFAFAALVLGLRLGLGCFQLRVVYFAIGAFLLLSGGARSFHFSGTTQGRSFRTRMGWAGQLVAVLTVGCFAVGLVAIVASVTAWC